MKISEKIIIIRPAKILSSLELFNNNFPIYVAAAPKIIKTMEKPNVKKIIGIKLIFFLSTNSFNELPDI